jgi:hypothetical protein
MPAALAVSLPPTPTALPTPVSAPPPSFDAPPPHVAPPPAAPRKMSRLAPRAAPAASGSASEVRVVLDEHHPALAARRPPPDPNEPQPGEDQTRVRKAHKTMIFAVVVLVALAAVGAYLVLTNWNSDDDRDGLDLGRPADTARPIYAFDR